MPVISLIASVTMIEPIDAQSTPSTPPSAHDGHHAGGRRLGVEVAVLRAVLGPEHGDLALEAVDRAPDVRLAEQHRGVVDQVAGREVVGAVDDEVVAGEDLEHVVVVEPRVVHDHVHVRVDLEHRVARRLGLRPADVALAVDDLALQVRLVDGVELDDAERADAGRGQVEQRGAAEAAGADAQHLGVLQPLLPDHPDLGDDDVPAVAADLVDGELLGGLDQRRQGHGRLLVRGSPEGVRVRRARRSTVPEPTLFPASRVHPSDTRPTVGLLPRAAGRRSREVTARGWLPAHGGPAHPRSVPGLRVAA